MKSNIICYIVIYIKEFKMSVKLLVDHVEKSVKTLKHQVSLLLQLQKGIQIMKDEIHMDEEEHGFERWLKEEGMYIKEHIPGDIIPDIALLHNAWFKGYHKVYDLYFANNSSWFGSKNSPKTLDMQEKEKMKLYLSDLLEIHEKLLHKFSILQLRVASSHEIDDEDIVETQEQLII